MKKGVILTVIGVLLLVFIGIGYKLFCLHRYDTKNFNSKTLVIKEKWMIESQPVSDEYLDLGNVRIRNDFKDFEKVAESEYSYKLIGESKKAGFTFIAFDSYVSGFESEFSNFGGYVDVKAINKFMKKHNFHDDIEFTKYLANYRDRKVNFFTRVDDMKENYASKYLSSMILLEGDMHELEGKYDGFAVKGKDYYEVYILDGEKKYVFSFSNPDNYFTDEYIKELIGTIELV